MSNKNLILEQLQLEMTIAIENTDEELYQQLLEIKENLEKYSDEE